MTEQHSEPVSLVGPVRYDLYIEIPEDGENAYSVDFAVNALTLPRVGDKLVFDTDADDGGMLAVEVTHVSHWFFGTTEEPPRRTIHVTANPCPSYRELTRSLREPTARDRWISCFPMLDAADAGGD